ALADTGDQSLARVPDIVHHCLLPGGVGDEATLLARQVDARWVAEAETPGHVGDGIDADAPGHIVEIDVAGILDPAQHVERAVALVAPAMEADTAQTHESGAEHGVARLHALFEGGHGGHGLEGRAWRVLAGDGL